MEEVFVPFRERSNIQKVECQSTREHEEDITDGKMGLFI